MASKKTNKKLPGKSENKSQPLETQFAEVAELVQSGRYKASKAVNSELINTYWCIG
jgi:hypothetical protein